MAAKHFLLSWTSPKRAHLKETPKSSASSATRRSRAFPQLLFREDSGSLRGQDEVSRYPLGKARERLVAEFALDLGVSLRCPRFGDVHESKKCFAAIGGTLKSLGIRKRSRRGRSHVVCSLCTHTTSSALQNEQKRLEIPGMVGFHPRYFAVITSRFRQKLIWGYYR